MLLGEISPNINNTTELNIKTKDFDEYIDSLDLDPIFSILLMHEPDYVDDLNIANYDLVLSGHSHNGQVNITLLKKLYLPVGSKKYNKEYYRINDTDLYIYNGTGTSMWKFRLFSRPSINLYRITKK